MSSENDAGNGRAVMRYIAPVVVTLAVFFAVAALGGLTESEGKEALRVISDAFTVPGAVVGGAGSLSWTASKGAYDIFGYVGSLVLDRLVPGHAVKKRQTVSYSEYRTRKEERGRRWLREWFVVGLADIVLGAVFAVWFSLK